MNKARLALIVVAASVVALTPSVAAASSPVLKTKHETAKNSIGNIR
jgi:hypothetical protein